MNKIDKELCKDIAAKLKLDSPAFVEKDYYGVQLLKIIMEIQLQN